MRATTADTATDHRIRSSSSRAAEFVAAVLLTDRWVGSAAVGCSRIGSVAGGIVQDQIHANQAPVACAMSCPALLVLAVGQLAGAAA